MTISCLQSLFFAQKLTPEQTETWGIEENDGSRLQDHAVIVCDAEHPVIIRFMIKYRRQRIGQKEHDEFQTDRCSNPGGQCNTATKSVKRVVVQKAKPTTTPTQRRTATTGNVVV